MDHRIFNVLMVDGEGRREGKRKNRKLGSPAVFLFVFLFCFFVFLVYYGGQAMECGVHPVPRIVTHDIQLK